MNLKQNYLLIALAAIVFSLSCWSCKRDKNKAGLKGNFDLVIYDTLKPAVKKDFVLANIFPFCDHGKWGFADRQGDIVIACEYDNCGFFTEGYAWVSKDKKYGFIDSTGRVCIDLMYEDVGSFNKGLAPVKKNNLYGFIDTTGKVVIPFQFESYNFNPDSTILIQQNRQWGIIDRKGKHRVLPVYDITFSFSDGLAVVQRNYKYGVINTSGKELIKCLYTDIKPCDRNKFIVTLNPNYKKHLYGLVDSTEKILIPLAYDFLEKTPGGAVIAKKDEKYGVLSCANDTLVPFIYQDIKAGNTNLLAARKQSWGFINLEGDSVLPFQYEDAKPFYNRHAVVKMNGKYGMIDINGEISIPFLFDKIENETDKIVKVWQSEKYGFYTCEGNKVADCIYDEKDYHGRDNNVMGFGLFKFGVAVVGSEGQIGMINEKGEMIAPLQYHFIGFPDDHGLCTANVAGNWGFLDITGKELCMFKYHEIQKDWNSGYYYAMVRNLPGRDDLNPRLPGNIGYFNMDGRLYSKSEYDSVKVVNNETLINRIKEYYNRIVSEEKGETPEMAKFNDTLTGYKTTRMFTVKDVKNKLQFDYFYHDSLNVHGPFFILKTDRSSGKPVYNRFYYDQGRFIQWLDNENRPQMLSSAVYAPENEEHYRARLFMAGFNSAVSKRNKQVNMWQAQLDKLAETIESNVNSGIYKKGDSDSQSQGEYQHSTNSYLNSKNQLMYDSEETSDESGSRSTRNYYNNGSLMLSVEEMQDYSEYSDLLPEEQWNMETRIERTYYHEGKAFRTVLTYTVYKKASRLGGDITEIINH